MTIENSIASTVSRAVALASMGGRAAYTGGVQLSRAARRFGRSARRLRRAPTLTLVRETLPASVALVAGVATVTSDLALSAVQTSDLAAMYDAYKINWIEVIVMPRYDPGQSGTVNNTQLWVAAACDPTAQLTAATWPQICAFDNHKIATLQDGKIFRYRYRPQVANALAGGNYALNASDWLILSSGGVALLHQRLLMYILSTNSSNINSVDIVYRYNFTVKQAK